MKEWRRQAMFVRAVIGIAGPLFVNACSAQRAEVPDGWKAECIGRAEVNLPGDLEIASSAERKLTEILQTTYQTPAGPASQFPDGQKAGYDNVFIAGTVYITSNIDDKTYIKLQEQAKRKRAYVEQWVERNPRMEDGRRREFSIPSTSTQDSVSLRVDATYTLLRRVGKSALLWESLSDHEGIGKHAAGLLAIDRAVPRLLYEVPSTTGICAPYAFVPDDGSVRRDVAVTYRLKSHPDITIWIDDTEGKGGSPSGNMSREKQSAEYDNEFFWSQNYQQRKGLQYVWRGTRIIDGIVGYATEVRLLRNDGTVDFGFYAAAFGDDREPASSSYRMFVIRDAANAKAKDLEPMNHDEFVKLAHAVVGSLKHRPVGSAQEMK